MDTLKIQALYHSIIGDRGKGDTPNSSDGVVAYWSSHLAGAQSELIVPGPHGSFALPQTISELKRILRLNLSAVSSSHRPDHRRSANKAEQPTAKSVARPVVFPALLPLAASRRADTARPGDAHGVPIRRRPG